MSSISSILRFSIWSAALPLLVLGLVAGPTAAQEGGEASAPEVFGEVIDVRVVNLEVVVTKDGERVHGLGPEDFELVVDGQEVPVEYFTEVLGGVAVAPEDSVARDATGTLPALRPGEPVGTSYLVFLDEHFTEPRDRDRVIDGLVEQIPNLQPQDRMAIVAYDGQRVEMLHNWTSNVRELTRVLRRAKARSTDGLRRRSEEQSFESRRELSQLRTLQGGALPRFDDGLDIEEEQYAEQVAGYVENAVRAASATMRGFAGPSGRKVMLLVSGGWPNDPARWVVADPVRSLRLTSDLLRGRDLLEPLWQTANRLGYTLYPVDAPGIDNVGIDAGDSTIEDAEYRQELRRTREQEEEFSLLALAEETGGEALLNSSRLAALERVVADTRSYYWLGFTPSWQGDDTEHEVEVRVKRPDGAKARSRESFSDLARTTEVSMMVESALLFGDAPGAVPLEVEVGRGQRAGWGKRDVPLSVNIPLAELTFLPTSDGSWATQVELRVAVLDENGNTAEVPVIPFGLRSQEPPADNDWTTYETTLRMRNHAHDLVVSLYDVASGKILAKKLTVRER